MFACSITWLIIQTTNASEASKKIISYKILDIASEASLKNLKTKQFIILWCEIVKIIKINGEKIENNRQIIETNNASEASKKITSHNTLDIASEASLKKP